MPRFFTISYLPLGSVPTVPTGQEHGTSQGTGHEGTESSGALIDATGAEEGHAADTHATDDGHTATVGHAAEGEHAEGEHHGMSFEGLMIVVLFVIAAMMACMALAKKGLNGRYFTNWWTQRAEQVHVFVENLCVGIIGEHGRKYMPMVYTFWCMIFFSNIAAVFLGIGPTADLSFNLGMALVAIGYVQYEGMKANGILGHFKHFAGPKLGIAMIPITAMIFVIEIISEVMKNLSLSLRLYGNIDGGHKAVEAMNKLGEEANIPVGALLIPIKCLTIVVQALIFCLLFCVYLSLVTHHEHEEGHGHDDHAEPAHGEPAAAH